MLTVVFAEHDVFDEGGDFSFTGAGAGVRGQLLLLFFCPLQRAESSERADWNKRVGKVDTGEHLVSSSTQFLLSSEG